MTGEFKLGEWLVQPQLNLLSLNGQGVRIEPKQMQVLLCLAEQAGDVVSKEHLIQVVWDGRFVSDEVLTSTVCELRKALGDEARKPRFIQTVPKRGYRLIAAVSPVPGPESQPLRVADRQVTTACAQPSHSRFDDARVHSWWKRWPLVVALLLLATMTALLIGWRQMRRADSPPIESLAVLPFKDLSGDASPDFFAESLTEALIAGLAKLKPLRVISHTSVVHYKTSDQSVSEIARELGVDAVLEGSVLREGERVRITVRLTDAATRQYLWAESYGRDVRGLFALQAEIAQGIAEQVQLSVTLAAQPPGPGDRAVDPSAYEAYLRGRLMWNRRTEEDTKKALEYFEQAIRLDPDFAPAYAGLADAYALLTSYNQLSPSDAFPKARAAALRALQLDHDLAEAHASLGMVKLAYEWDWAGAEEGFKRAMTLNPNYTPAQLWYGQYLWAAGRLDEAIQAVKRAQELDPKAVANYLTAAAVFIHQRQYDQALAAYRQVLDLNPNEPTAYKAMSRIYAKKGLLVEAEALWQKAAEIAGWPKDLRWSSRSTDAGKDDRLLDHLNFLLKQKYVRPTSVAKLYADFNDKERAFAWLERAWQERDSQLLFLRLDESWDKLRDDPRFTNLVRRMFPGDKPVAVSVRQ
jgi:TolB-like protein/DNA-binding winged helix-turn-helix (wHTH) protein/tetratricopeptide (TPR) repeat protein